MISLDWNLSDFKDKVKQEHRHIADVSIEGNKQISDFFGSKTNKVYTFVLVLLSPDEIFTLNVVVLAQKLQKLKSSSICPDAGL